MSMKTSRDVKGQNETIMAVSFKEMNEAMVKTVADSLEASLFGYIQDSNPRRVYLDKLVELICHNDKVKVVTELHRQACDCGDTQGAKRYKQSMYCFGGAALFEGGHAKKHVTAFTRTVFVDIDDLTPEQIAEMLAKIRADEHTLLCYVTISGKGIRVIARIEYSIEMTSIAQEGEAYDFAFEKANEYYANLVGIEHTDTKCKDYSRLSILAHDPNVWYNPSATPFMVEVLEKRPVGRPRKRATAQGVEPQVEEWLRSLGKVFQVGDRNDYVHLAACQMNRLGVNVSDCVEWAVEKYEEEDFDREEITTTVRSAYTNTEEHGTYTPGRGKTGQSRTADVLEIRGYLIEQNICTRFNTITHKYELFDEQRGVWYEMTDRDENDIALKLTACYGKRIQKADLSMVLQSGYSVMYNPILEFLNGLPEWDGVDYIREVANRVHTNADAQDLHNWFFRKWFVWTVAGWIDPNVSNQLAYILVGRQNSFKTSFLRHLLPPQLRDLIGTLNLRGFLTSDDYLMLASHLFIELDEFDNLSPKELALFKSLMTMDKVGRRAAYARHSENRTRIATFFGSTNNLNYLNDDYGNRRCLSVSVESIDSPYENPINYEQLYAQAYHLLKSGFRYIFTSADYKMLAEHNAEFESASIEEESIKTHFRQPREGEKGQFFQVAEAISYIQLYNSGVRLNATRTRDAFRKLGFEEKKIGTKTSPNYGKRGFIVVLYSQTEIEANRSRHESISA